MAAPKCFFLLFYSRTGLFCTYYAKSVETGDSVVADRVEGCKIRELFIFVLKLPVGQEHVFCKIN